ncbi:gluzincin family metallopeptidase [Peredibacter starrii]|uniref:Lipoprotein n=1 Tax=Peredibacter starrii TaxID=28202 RepID=A0AAX4HSV6_9BACT|nr:hypothetical protein [Peredibacter starrii]WPU66374.1 hypothetical protein SOO65_06415 [Peredibacter starrii]
MKVVRQRMIKPIQILLLPVLVILNACNPTEITGSGLRNNIIQNDGSLDGKAYIYRDNPTIYEGPNYGPNNPDMNRIVDKTKFEFITNNTTLTSNCSIDFFFYGNYTDSLANCVRSLSNSTQTQALPRKSDRTYIFDVGTPEFYQVNALYHINLGTKAFFDKLSFAYNTIHALSAGIPKSIPQYLKDSDMFWFKSVTNTDSKQFKNDFLTSYSQCHLDDNASFSPAGPTLCFGGSATHTNFYFVQDPTVIYHELAHALVSVMMNIRNGTANQKHPLRSNLGGYGYDEGGSLNEGIADYFSFVINKRTHFGEWALGRGLNQSRPMSESDAIHITGVEETSEGRLSYPQYLLYDPNFPDDPHEDVHYAGQIVSHYLVALTKSFKNECNISTESDGGHDKATSYVMLLLAETLSEIGDLNAKGIDDYWGPYSNNTVFFNNLDFNNSYIWSHVNNQATYRRFFQIFSKNIYKYITGNICPSFDKNDSEKLLDDYGLLLFKTYNNNGNSTKDRSLSYNSVVSFIPTQGLTQVSENNRRKSVLVSKQLLQLAEKTDTNTDRVGFYIIDNRTDMQNLLTDLLFKGFTVPLSTSVSSIDYNNNNIKVSPGEVVAIIPNLQNNSNSTMAGVQLLASDWDHVHITDDTTGNFKPCVIDSVTTVDQGGEAGNTCTTTDPEYKRLVKNTSTGKFPTSAAAPVCMVQLEEGSSTRWVSQNEFRKKNGLSLLDKDCLGYNSTGTTDTDFTFNPHECLVRFLPGANHSFYSKIDAQKTYYESVVKESSNKTFNAGNLMIMEVNKWIPPGTKFRCRMRARFNNCTDCYTDGTYSNDDYIDSELNGAKPFQIINFDFDVND